MVWKFDVSVRTAMVRCPIALQVYLERTHWSALLAKETDLGWGIKRKGVNERCEY